VTRIDDPASAVAAALCASARMPGGTGTTRRHPRRCGWCDYPVRELAAMVAAFNQVAGRDERRGTWARHDVRVFTGLPHDAQVAQVAAAQEIEPMGAAAARPADGGAPEEESVPWA
jgi:hypothetical protein